MREIIPIIQSWLKSGKKMAMVTVVSVEGSSPRPTGSKMIISDRNEMEGSVSGGCVETSVIVEALAAIKDGKTRLLYYGIDDSNPWSVGLACGGRIEVFVEPLFDERIKDGFSLDLFQKCVELINQEESFVLSLAISGNNQGMRGLIVHSKWVVGNSTNIWSNLATSTQHSSISNRTDARIIDFSKGKESKNLVFIDPILPQAKMIIVGAVHIAVSLTKFAKNLGFKTFVIDPRKAFLTMDRFPDADQLIQKWPEETISAFKITSRDCIIVLSHDDKIDIPAMAAALKSNAGYIGMLGSKKTKAERFESLEKMGFKSSDFQNVHAPIGMNIKAVTPEEIAISIMAEIIANSRGKESHAN